MVVVVVHVVVVVVVEVVVVEVVVVAEAVGRGRVEEVEAAEAIRLEGGASFPHQEVVEEKMGEVNIAWLCLWEEKEAAKEAAEEAMVSSSHIRPSCATINLSSRYKLHSPHRSS